MTVESSSMAFGARSEEVFGAHAGPEASSADVALELTAAVIAIRDNAPVVLVVADKAKRADDALPCGRFVPGTHTSLELSLREHVRRLTGLELGYVEQLYTFGNGTLENGGEAASEPRTISIAYLALVLGAGDLPRGSCAWRSVYDYFPWEDWRNGRPGIIAAEIEPRLKAWAEANTHSEPGVTSLLDLRERTSIAFGLDGARWDDERVLERFELMCEAGLVPGGIAAARDRANGAGSTLGRAMHFDHRRIVAAAIGRLRGKIRYRPVVFELMEPEFTLYDLQRTVEAILGPHLHKQNFRRLVESVGLVEPTGEIRTHTGGRPARLYRFRREVLLERPAPGVRVKAVARG